YGILLIEVGCWEVLGEKQFPNIDLEAMQQVKESLANKCDGISVADYGGLVSSCILRVAGDRPDITYIRERLDEESQSNMDLD
ncbi:9846_t:CDS:1, partial [Acaulospora morrowiae]